jgi:GntR family transcriptional repressor for pyruvate dehydrogenase complex
LHEQIADSIEQVVAREQLGPGTQLPPERELAEMLGVSRPTVREALRLLQERGLVRMRVGSGTFVTDVPASSVADSIERFLVFGSCSYEELLTARRILEPDMAALAAERATPEDLTRLGELVEAIETACASNDVENYADVDASFHEALASATHNRLIVAIAHSFERVMREWIRAVTEVLVAEEGARSHRLVYDALLAGDADRAREAMLIHMRTARSDLRDERLGARQVT